MKRIMRILLASGAISALLLLMLLAWSTGNASRLEEHYTLLLALNSVVALALGAWVITLTVRLVRQLRRRQFGARLTARLALAFALVGVVPGVLIYTLSVQFLSRSIESWFNVRVDAALDAGLGLGRAALDSLLTELNGKARAMALELGDLPNNSDAGITVALTRLRERANVPDAMVFTGNGTMVAFATSRYSMLVPEQPPTMVLNQLRTARGYAAAESGNPTDPDAPDLTLRVVVPLVTRDDVASLGGLLRTDTRYLQLTQPVPDQIADNANQVQAGYRDYQELALSRQGLRKLYGITLTLALLLAGFTAIAAAFALSSRLVRPLLRLAAGTQAVSVGDYRALPEPPSRDEVGQLTRSFNAMTRQLAEARRMVENNRHELERANAYLENVLATLSSGVLVFDESFRVTTINQGAQRILRTDLRTVTGRPLDTLPGLAPFARTIRQAFAEHAAAATGRQHWQKQIALTPPDAARNDASEPGVAHGAPHETTLTLLARGAHLTVDGDGGYVVVFDDITDVISANRVVAWGEVARRLAHEIKNPLTPIQLSAERIQMKLEHRLEEADAAMLRRATTTIVNQVASMQAMVDDFREYARTPTATTATVDLNALVGEVLTLYGWDPVDAPHGVGGLELDVALSPDVPPVQGDPTRLRQVIHNLVANARDAIEPPASPSPPPPGPAHVAPPVPVAPAPETIPATGGCIGVTTRLVRARLPDGTAHAAVKLTVTDTGPGFAEHVLQRAFEPYITTKARGTGLGLAIVKKIIEEHGGRIELANRPEGGAIVSILLTRVENNPYTADNADNLDMALPGPLHEQR